MSEKVRLALIYALMLVGILLLFDISGSILGFDSSSFVAISIKILMTIYGIVIYILPEIFEKDLGVLKKYRFFDIK